MFRFRGCVDRFLGMGFEGGGVDNCRWFPWLAWGLEKWAVRDRRGGGEREARHVMSVGVAVGL